MPLIKQGPQGEGTRFRRKETEFKFGHKGTQIETSGKKTELKTNCGGRTRLEFSSRNLSQKVITKSLQLLKKENRKGRNKKANLQGRRKKNQRCHLRNGGICPSVVSWEEAASEKKPQAAEVKEAKDFNGRPGLGTRK